VLVWKSRHKDGRHFRSKRRTLFGEPHYQKYSEIISLENPDAAKGSAGQMLREFRGASTRAKRVRVKRAVVQAANRAGVASGSMRLSSREREEARQIAKIYNDAKAEMVIPPKNM
jgi:hypothetical protein